MISPLSRYRNPGRLPVRTFLYLTLVGLLSDCGNETAYRTPITTTAPRAAQESTECSFVGRLACNAMAAVSMDGSADQQTTCTASRNGGTYVETCGTGAAAMAAPKPPPPKPQVAAAAVSTVSRSSVQLSWKDNSDNETGFVIERCDQVFRDVRSAKMTVTCRGAWRTVGSVTADTTTFVDDNVTANQTYIYRVKATNPSGSSAYTPEAVITAPVR
jgi:hypothetical protein